MKNIFFTSPHFMLVSSLENDMKSVGLYKCPHTERNINVLLLIHILVFYFGQRILQSFTQFNFETKFMKMLTVHFTYSQTTSHVIH